MRTWRWVRCASSSARRCLPTVWAGRRAAHPCKPCTSMQKVNKCMSVLHQCAPDAAVPPPAPAPDSLAVASTAAKLLSPPMGAPPPAPHPSSSTILDPREIDFAVVSPVEAASSAAAPTTGMLSGGAAGSAVQVLHEDARIFYDPHFLNDGECQPHVFRMHHQGALDSIWSRRQMQQLQLHTALCLQTTACTTLQRSATTSSPWVSKG